VLQTLADQVAVAIDNARLFQQVQKSLDAERRAYGQLSREAWRDLMTAETELGFFSDARDTVPAGDLWRPEMRTALRTGEITSGDGGGRLAIPIKVRHEVVGVIDGRKSDGAAWTSEEIDMLETLTEQLSVTLESARLYRDTQRRAERERLVADITSKVRASSDVEAIMRTAVRELGRAMNTDRTRVQLTPGRVTQEDNGS
jgi:GAF domain-containing protein